MQPHRGVLGLPAVQEPIARPKVQESIARPKVYQGNQATLTQGPTARSRAC